MATTEPITAEPRRFSFCLPRPLWIGLVTAVLVVVAVGLQFGVPIYRQQLALREIERLRGRVVTREGGPAWLRQLVGDTWMTPFDRVVRVDLEHRHVQDSDLASLRWLSDLEVLILARTEITDDGLKHICHLQHLKRLDLRVTEITDHGLAILQQLPAIEGLDVGYTWVTKSAVAALVHDRPNIRAGVNRRFDEILKLRSLSGSDSPSQPRVESTTSWPD